MNVHINFILLLFLLNHCIASSKENSVKIERKRDFFFKLTLNECPENYVQCTDGTCLPRSSFCNGIAECNSDEILCGVCPAGQFECVRPVFLGTQRQCYPASNFCNGRYDCASTEEEEVCSSTELLASKSAIFSEIEAARSKALKWLLEQRNDKRVTYKWGTEAARIAVAVHFMNSFENTSISNYASVRDELAYEVMIRLLTRMALKPLSEISVTELASYINALLATCVDPRDFEVIDLVEELKRRKESSKCSNPYVILALCNAGETVTAEDTENLQKEFKKSKRRTGTDNQALIIMALSCASKQPNPIIDISEIQELSQDIKKKQYRNGTVQNLKTTGLVLQALFASDPDSDTENFDEEKALKQILQSQKKDGSFGSVSNAYFVLPVLVGMSLVNVTNGHCEKLDKSENEMLNRLINRVGPKWSIGVSIWIGDNRTVERSLMVTVPINTTAFQLMETAATLDSRFKFQFNMFERKPYIYSISGIQDDPESRLYWFQHIQTNTNEVTAIKKSPGEVIPTEKQQLIYWYKHGPCTKEEIEAEEKTEEPRR